MPSVYVRPEFIQNYTVPEEIFFGYFFYPEKCLCTSISGTLFPSEKKKIQLYNYNTMLKKIISAGLILSAVLFTTQVKAQVASARSIAEVATKEMSYLGLTESQANKVTEINKMTADALIALDNKAGDNSSSQNNKMIADEFVSIIAQCHQAMEQILTPEQMAVVKQDRAEKIALFRTLIMVPILDLTERQVEQVYEINFKGVQKVQKDFGKRLNKKNAGPEDADSNKAKKVIISDFKVLDKDFKKILSPEQYEVYKNNQDLIRESAKKG